ncbi:tyrosine-protein phosphatase [Wukongibacter sp. M2B1]|uniref:tyrosine-protein phosphatase n=1 Tax=Wukongibacter sp. M2B1 TaxID=3088895 RepID=UPI003D7AE99D
MIDIHCHILPYVDDGAKHMDEAVQMARIAYEQGIKKIVATPHYIEDGEYLSVRIDKKVERLNYVLKQKKIELEVLVGNEVFITPNLPSLIKSRKINTINQTQYLLIEFPLFSLPNYIENVIFELKLIGIVPIIAHPERYRFISENPNVLIKYIDIGVLCQINSGSIIGDYGKAIMEASLNLIKHDMAHVVASDAHSMKGRSPRLKIAYEKVQKLYGEEKAKELFYVNTRKIVEGKDLNISIPKRIKRKDGVKKLLDIFKLNSKKIQ